MNCLIQELITIGSLWTSNGFYGKQKRRYCCKDTKVLERNALLHNGFSWHFQQKGGLVSSSCFVQIRGSFEILHPRISWLIFKLINFVFVHKKSSQFHYFTQDCFGNSIWVFGTQYHFYTILKFTYSKCLLSCVQKLNNLLYFESSFKLISSVIHSLVMLAIAYLRWQL